MPIQDCVHLFDRAAVIIADAPLGLVNDQIPMLLVHGANLPLSFRFATAQAAVEIIRNAVKMTEHLPSLGVNHRAELMVISAAPASPACRQRRERSHTATAELAP